MRNEEPQHDDREGGGRRDAYRREGPSGRAIVLLLALVVLGVFVLQNLHLTDISFLFWNFRVKTAFGLLIAAALAFVAGYVTARLRRGSKLERERLGRKDRGDGGD